MLQAEGSSGEALSERTWRRRTAAVASRPIARARPSRRPSCNSSSSSSSSSKQHSRISSHSSSSPQQQQQQQQQRQQQVQTSDSVIYEATINAVASADTELLDS
ncbi:unnamed protein product [Trichogramma brassicae]|uniref:Uncharacterized protein n=1 Tax=Trichogramma brassicae TaxID=86971 RepID=A0A6H5IUV5_9HYME|nr:unnamed protein product [Trichogramma brassicae]